MVVPPELVDVEVEVVPEVVDPPAAAAAARVGSLVTVLVITIGEYPGAETVPPETMETGCAAGCPAVSADY